MAALPPFLFACIVLAACACAGLVLSRRESGGLWRCPPLYAPAAGLAAFTLIASACGWLVPLSTPFTRGASLLLLAAALWFARGRLRETAPLLLWLAPAAAAAGWPLWTSLLRYGSFDFYNDAYTYLVHAAWLRGHAFHEAPRAPDQFPALTQISLYQNLDLRMGASFFLAWLHGLSGAPRSLFAYPAAMAAAIGAGIFALAGILRLASGARPAVCLAAALVPAVSLSGVSFSAAYGFLPQTFGLVFALAALGLAAEGCAAGAALCLAAHAVSYPEALPFTLAAGAVFLFMPPLRRAAAWALLGGAILALPELPRTLKGLRVQASAPVGTHNPLDLRDAVFHAGGFAGGPWEGWTRLIDPGWLSALLALAVFAASLAGLRFTHNRKILFPFAALVLLLAGAFLWFRLVEDNSWRQGKAAAWAAWPTLAILLTGLLSLLERGPRLRFAALVLLGLWLAAGAWRHWELATPRTAELRQHTRLARDHFLAYERAAAALRSLPPGEAAVLEGFSGPRDKHRELLTYFVMDERPLLADWTGDDYVGIVLPNPDTRRPGAPWRLGPGLIPRPAR